MKKGFWLFVLSVCFTVIFNLGQLWFWAWINHNIGWCISSLGPAFAMYGQPIVATEWWSGILFLTEVVVWAATFIGGLCLDFYTWEAIEK